MCPLFSLPCPIEFKIVNDEEIAEGKHTRVHKIKQLTTTTNFIVRKFLTTDARREEKTARNVVATDLDRCQFSLRNVTNLNEKVLMDMSIER